MGQKQRPAPAEHKPGRGGHNALGRGRYGRLEIKIGASCEAGVHLANEDEQAFERAGPGEILPLALQLRQTLRGGTHSLALAPDERLRLLAEAGDRLVAGQPRRLRVLVEPADHAAEFLDGAAKPLPVLLGEFRQLRRSQGANQPDCQCEDTPDDQR